MAPERPTISTHVLDTGTGLPRAGATVRLWRLAASDGPATLVVEAETDADGRVRDLLGPTALEAAAYALEFDLGGELLLVDHGRDPGGRPDAELPRPAAGRAVRALDLSGLLTA